MTENYDSLTASYIKVINTGHAGVISFVGQKRPALSHSKARKLVYVYRGSSRGKRYSAFSSDVTTSCWTHVKRLVRIPNFVAAREQ